MNNTYTIKINDIRKYIHIRKDLSQGYSLPVATFKQDINIQDYRRIDRVIKAWQSK